MNSSEVPTPGNRTAWTVPVAVNLCLGIVGVIPVWGLVLFAVNFPLASLGITTGSATENDGMLPWLLVLVPMWAVLLGLWIPANIRMRRKRTAAGRRYWIYSSLLVLVPTVALMVVIETVR
ncbi:hypothetical protein [Streptomyces sp. NPDC005573]|uniref:hypothetical protein n=1 Tax=Streptomyces sp. NPDC005573 TaxID=3156890 RepID=UPI0033B3B943